MIERFVKQWDKNKNKLIEFLSTQNENEFDYEFLVKALINNVINDEDALYAENLDSDALTVIDNGHYQGTLLFVVPVDTYQPSEDEYYFTVVGYGSCSGCDTLQSIKDYHYEDEDTKPSKENVDEYMTLCLHLLQRFKKLVPEEK
jgi:hypothetical protein